MSKIGDLVIEMGELYQDKHPDASWEEAMEVVTSGNEEAKELMAEVLEMRREIG
jgi:hypothetical protein